jgi:hypothetical protein
MTWKQKRSKTDALHLFLCIEEPETLPGVHVRRWVLAENVGLHETVARR